MDEHEAKHIEQQIANEEDLKGADPETVREAARNLERGVEGGVIDKIAADESAAERPLTPEEEEAKREEPEAIQGGREQQEGGGLPDEARGPDRGGAGEPRGEAPPTEGAAPEGEQAAVQGANEYIVDEPVHLHQIDKIFLGDINSYKITIFLLDAHPPA